MCVCVFLKLWLLRDLVFIKNEFTFKHYATGTMESVMEKSQSTYFIQLELGDM